MKKYKCNIPYWQLKVQCMLFCLFVCIYRFNLPVNNFSVMTGCLGINQNSVDLMCLAQGHNMVHAVGIEPQDLSIWSPMLYHYATELGAPCICDKNVLLYVSGSSPDKV